MASGISVVMVKRDVEDLEHQTECQQATMGARIPHHLLLAVSNGLFPKSWRVFFMENPKKWMMTGGHPHIDIDR